MTNDRALGFRPLAIQCLWPGGSQHSQNRGFFNTFWKYPPRQKASFTIDQVMEALTPAVGR
jgi:hypothetical protein